MRTTTLESTTTEAVRGRDANILRFLERRSDDALTTLVKNHQPNDVLRVLQRFWGSCIHGHYSFFILAGTEGYVPTKGEYNLARKVLEQRKLRGNYNS